MSSVIQTLQNYYRQRDLAAREWKKQGGKVVGYLCDNVPEEIILAAGFFPLRLSGDIIINKVTIDNYQDFPAEGFVHSILNMMLSGSYDFLDFLIVPQSRNSISQLYYILTEAQKSNPSLKLPQLYFFDNLNTRFYLSGLYNRDRVFELKKKIEEWSARMISNESLSRAITIGNENKMLLKKVAAIRSSEPPRISGVEALQIIGSSMFMLKEEHNKLLKKYLENAEKLPASNGIRVFVEGSPIDNLQLYEIIESCEATVVAEDNCWGNRYSDIPVDTSSNPLEAIVDRYHNKSPCPRMYPLNRRVSYCLKSALDAKVKAAIFYVLESDETQAWETPDEIKALEEKGIRTLLLNHQKYIIDKPEQLKTQIKEFIESVKGTM